MKKNFKQAVLLTSVLMALSGCLDDPFNYSDSKTGDGSEGGTGGPVEGGEVTQIYGEASDGTFVLQATDKDGVTADVDGKENSALSNIQVTGDFENKAALNVAVTENAKAGIQFVSNSYADYSEQNVDNKGTLLVDLHVKEFPNSKMTPVTVTLKSEDGSEASVDITSSISAYLGANNPKAEEGISKTQTVRIPLQCFDKGIDLSKVTQPFSMNMTDNANFDISNVRIQAESGGDTPGSKYVIECDHSAKSEVITAPQSVIVSRQKNDKDEFENTGWANHTAKEGDLITPVNAADPSIGWIGVKSTAAQGKQTYLSFILKEDEKLKDISQYMEKGVLKFNLWLAKDSDIAHATHNFILKLDTPSKTEPDSVSKDYRYPSSNLYTIQGKVGEIVPVEIPLIKFYQKTDGSIDVNAIKYLKKFAIFPEKSADKTYTPSGMEYSVSDVQLVMAP